MDEMSLEQYQKYLAEVLLSPNLNNYEIISRKIKLSPENNTEENYLQAARIRLDIYRNNFIYSLTEALGEQFPVVKKLVGNSFFLALARDYVILFPPQETAIFSYGNSFSGFIRQHEHCQPLPYLADIALLEWHYQTSVNAVDEQLLNPEELAKIEPELLGEQLFPIQSSVILFSSPYPIVLIYNENLKEKVKTINIKTEGSSYAIILRRDLEVKIIDIDVSTFHLLNELKKTNTINQAWQSTKNKFSLTEDKFSTIFCFLLNIGAFKKITITPQTSLTVEN